jgi:hypothetical protein
MGFHWYVWTGGVTSLKKRKISGSTRSDNGRRCRDTFASLKKTCRKNGLSFWQYLHDRLFGRHRIAPLAQWIFAPTPASPPPDG